jgi:hypothetical protein
MASRFVYYTDFATCSHVQVLPLLTLSFKIRKNSCDLGLMAMVQTKDVSAPIQGLNFGTLGKGLTH